MVQFTNTLSMREIFRGYYQPTDNEFIELWNNSIFSFDANILLNIYRYSEDTREKFIQILKELSPRIIIPHQAALEYQNKRLKVIKDQEDAYNDIIGSLKKSFGTTKSHLNRFKNHPLIKVEDIISELDKIYTAIEVDLQEKQKIHPDLFCNDKLRDELTSLLKDIGNPSTSEEIKEIKEDCKYRYENSIPPGFKDYNSNEDKNSCGDLILWNQLIKIAKEKELPMIFVTDDKKEDWWWKYAGKTIGPRHELIKEFYDKAEVQFYMYQTDQFIKYAENKLFGKESDPELIKEVQDVMYQEKNIFRTKKSRYLDNVKSNIWKTNFDIDLKQAHLLGYNVLLISEIDKFEDRLDEIKYENHITKSQLNELEISLNLIEEAFMEYTQQIKILTDHKKSLYHKLEKSTEEGNIDENINTLNKISEVEKRLDKNEEDALDAELRINNLKREFHEISYIYG
jgi:hypothetical protein